MFIYLWSDVQIGPAHHATSPKVSRADIDQYGESAANEPAEVEGLWHVRHFIPEGLQELLAGHCVLQYHCAGD